MLRINLVLGGWESDPEADHALVVAMVNGLAGVNRVLIQRGDVPGLYASGVVFEKDPPGRDVWRDCADVLRAGMADCKSLVAWRLAELQQAGVWAEVSVEWYTAPSGARKYHVALRTARGIEDPSRILGMT